MTRKKVKLAYIMNDSTRKATYNKRKKGLIKKVSELSTLCDVQACAIIYSPYHTQPEIWPPTLVEIHEVLSRFRKVPYLEQNKKMVDPEMFLKERIKKAEEQLRKQRSNNQEKMVNNIVFNCLRGRISLTSLPPDYLDDIAKAVDEHIKDVDEKLVEISRRATCAGAGAGVSSSTAAPANGVNLVGAVRSLPMIPVTNDGSDGGGVVVAPGSKNMDNLWYMELVNNNSPAALSRPAVPMATEEHMAVGPMGGEMMMGGAAAAGGSGDGWKFGEGSSSTNWVGNNEGFGNYTNINGFWDVNNHF
ncbi:Agamous-like MADS-box protein AGL80 [Linum grandiflorum]